MIRATNWPSTAEACRRQGGFSLIEVLVALGLFAVVLAGAFLFLDRSHRILETESNAIESRYAARVAIEEMAYHVQQAGFGVQRGDPYNAGSWQREVVHAGSHMIAFNADVDPGRGPIDPTVILTFPDGSSYRGEGPAAATDGAETYIYSLDANGDGTITTVDRESDEFPDLDYHPAHETETPHDYGLFRRIYGYDGSGTGGGIEPITGYLFTNATSSDVYPDGTSPTPLFAYWLTEDLDGDGRLGSHECTVPPCPPSSPRRPRQYLWGDNDFDGTLSESEKDAARGLPVGDPAWGWNPRMAAGSYHSTRLAVAADTGSSVLKVLNALDFGPGDMVQIGTGPSAETIVVSSVDTSVGPHEILLSTTPSVAHAASSTVQIHPRTLLRMIRSVELTFDAITPRRDYNAATGSAAVGRAGRVGTRGLDYRVWGFQRQVELVNQQARSLGVGANDAPASGSPGCPNTLSAYIEGQEVTSLDVYVPRSTPLPLMFIARDDAGEPLPGYTLLLTHSSVAHGALSTTSVVTDLTGIGAFEYTATGVHGIDTITARNPCFQVSGTPMQQRADLLLRIHELDATLAGNDCLTTYRAGQPVPTSGFAARVIAPSGATVPDHPLDLSLELDEASLPGPPDFTTIQAELVADSLSLGFTSTTDGTLGPEYATTGSAAQLSGSVSLVQDDAGEGGRALLEVEVRNPTCSFCGTSTSFPIGFYRLVADSTIPYPGCNELTPCSIGVLGVAPSVRATLSIGGQPVPGAALTFTLEKLSGSPGSAGLLDPATGWITNGSGDSDVIVHHNNDPGIRPFNPLKTRLTVVSTGNNSVCANADIVSESHRSEFWFRGKLLGY